MRSLRKFTSYYRLLLAGNPSKWDLGTLLLAVLGAIAAGIPFPIVGIIFGQLLDDFNSATCNTSTATDAAEQHSVNNKILLIFYLAIAQFILIYLHLTCWTLTGARLAQRLREQYLQSLLQQEPLFFDKLPPGEVASRLNGDIQAIRSGTSEKVGICLSSLSFFVTAYIVAFIKNTTLAAILLSLIPAYFIMSFVGSHYIEKYAGKMSDFSASAASIASEALSNIIVVQAFGANTRLEKKFSEALEGSEREGIKKATATGIQAGCLYFISYAANGLAFWMGSRQIAKVVDADPDATGTSVGAVFTVIFVLVEATLLLSQVAPFIHLFGAAVASHEKLGEDIDRLPLIDSSGNAGARIQAINGALQFQGVSFQYPSRPDVLVLDEISLNLLPQKHTAIVGLSGSGKSTIAGLVGRLYDANSGRILLDGHDIRELDARDLRSHISLVQQEPSLLNRSILENIAYGLINSSVATHVHLQPVLLGQELEELAGELRSGSNLESAAERRSAPLTEIVRLVTKAAVLADADTFVNALQHGYGTIVGASGRLLSGGQQQRICLARAVVKDPAILILDEATASLDSRSEQRIQKAISSISSGRTVLTIAHRLSTITNADNIIVMHRGRLIEQGTHAELMAIDGGTYAASVYMQGLASTSEMKVQDESIESSRSSTYDSSNEKAALAHEVALDDHEHEHLSIVRPRDNEADGLDDLATPSRSLWALARGYAPALRPQLLTLMIALLGSVIVGGAFSGEAVIFGNTVGSLSPCKTPASIRSSGDFFGLMFFVLAIIEFFANLVSWAGFGWVSEKIVHNIRVLSFRSLFEQDLQWHQSEGRNPASLLSYITRDGAALAGLSGSVIGTIISITINLFASIILTHIIAWRIALVCLSLVPFLLGAGLMELRVLGKFEEKHETAYTTSVDIGVEAVSSIKTVSSLCLQDKVLATYRESLVGPKKETLRVTLQASFWQAMTYFLGNLVNALAYWWGAKQIIAGNYTQTQFLIVVFSLLVGALLWAQMFALAPELSSARGAMARILSLIEIGSDGMQGCVRRHGGGGSLAEDVEASAESKMSLSPYTGGSSVQLSNVHFSYPARPGIKVLDGLSIDIKAGQFCALVGPSGAGKSTIISLVERLYTPKSGAVVIDGIDITKQRNVTFRESIALVPQESVLFEGSIAFNIGLGARSGHHVVQSEIEEACKLANIHDVIMALPSGYETRCGPNGNQFSGGQKQRLSIARALVRKPKLLILDESTSALDAESESLLQQGLEKAAAGITVIAIAHRLHTIRRADVIFLIEGGKCVDSGSHDELLVRSESYRENVMHQTVATE